MCLVLLVVLCSLGSRCSINFIWVWMSCSLGGIFLLICFSCLVRVWLLLLLFLVIGWCCLSVVVICCMVCFMCLLLVRVSGFCL